MEYEDRLTIATPESVEIELTLAGLGSRAAARVVDLAFIGVISAALGLGLLAGGAFSSGGNVSGFAIAAYVAAIFLITLFYDVLFEVRGSGRTPGKRLLGLRVLQASGHPIGFRSSAVRNVLRLVEDAPLGWVPATASVLVTRRNQRIGDLAADAIVVRDRVGPRRQRAARGLRRRRDGERPEATARPETPAGGLEAWDVSAVTGEELAAVRQFLDRRSTLDPEPRGQLAAQLTDRLRRKVTGPTEELSPEAFLERLVLAKDARR